MMYFFIRRRWYKLSRATFRVKVWWTFKVVKRYSEIQRLGGAIDTLDLRSKQGQVEGMKIAMRKMTQALMEIFIAQESWIEWDEIEWVFSTMEATEC
jgi:hypothetical protein